GRRIRLAALRWIRLRPRRSAHTEPVQLESADADRGLERIAVAGRRSVGPHRRGPAPRALGDALLSGLWRRDPDRNSDPGRHIPRTALRTRLRRWCGRDRGARELPAATLAGRGGGGRPNKV